MAKEWILNMATNRWGLNKKDSVGPVSEWIRECSPKTVNEWEIFYFNKLKEFLTLKNVNFEPYEYLEYLGKKLYIKITEVIRAEIEEVSENDCVEYIYNLVINRTFEGFSIKKGDKKEIYNKEVIEQIKDCIKTLKSLKA
jgi:hypothetical protein